MELIVFFLSLFQNGLQLVHNRIIRDKLHGNIKRFPIPVTGKGISKHSV
jgi:hypothetical protein